MKYSGPQIQLPLQESGIVPRIEQATLESAELILGSKGDILTFLKDKDFGVILFDATGEILRSFGHYNVILVGGHNMSGQEREFIKARSIRLFSTESIIQEGIQNICDVLMESANQWPSLHICINLSILDQQTGGLTTRELLYFLQRLRLLKNYLSASVIGGLSPLTAKILAESCKS